MQICHACIVLIAFMNEVYQNWLLTSFYKVHQIESMAIKRSCQNVSIVDILHQCYGKG